jgi:hypothetical protein
VAEIHPIVGSRRPPRRGLLGLSRLCFPNRSESALGRVSANAPSPGAQRMPVALPSSTGALGRPLRHTIGIPGVKRPAS